MSARSLRYLDAGEAALVVEFGTTVDPIINDRVLALDAALNALALEGVREMVPTYRSLMIHYDPLTVERETIIATVQQIEAGDGMARKPGSRWMIPCCYDPVFGEDIAHIARSVGLSPEQVVQTHAGATYRAYMYGFAPGFCYLGGLPPELAISRRTDPRPPTPSNVILVGGGLSLVSTFSMPTGWWLIGRTPEDMFAPAREPIFLVEIGEEVRFEPIDRATHDALEKRVAAGEVVAQRVRLE